MQQTVISAVSSRVSAALRACAEAFPVESMSLKRTSVKHFRIKRHYTIKEHCTSKCNQENVRNFLCNCIYTQEN